MAISDICQGKVAYHSERIEVMLGFWKLLEDLYDVGGPNKQTGLAKATVDVAAMAHKVLQCSPERLTGKIRWLVDKKR